MPWARSFCPFRACGAKLAKQGVWGKTCETGRVGQNLRNRACGAKLAKLQYYMISSMHISVGVTGRSPSSLIFWKSKQIPILYACGIWVRNLS